MWILMVASAMAGELNFSPDRPGLGESTATVGELGHAMIEGGYQGLYGGGFGITSLGAIGRIGIVELAEARVRVPSLLIASGLGTAVGPVGLGAKVAAPLSDSLAVSVVPEVLVGFGATGGVGAQLSGNVTYTTGNLTPWGHLMIDTTVSVLAGGGVAYSLDSAGFYGNAGVNIVSGGGAAALIGGGGWLALSDALQLDAGIDLLVGGAVVISPLIGVSGGF